MAITKPSLKVLAVDALSVLFSASHRSDILEKAIPLLFSIFSIFSLSTAVFSLFVTIFKSSPNFIKLLDLLLFPWEP